MHPNSTYVTFAADAGIVSALGVVQRLLDEDRANRVLVFCAASARAQTVTRDEVVSLGEPMSDSPSIQGSDEATEFATRLLENYKGQLARRSPKAG